MPTIKGSDSSSYTYTGSTSGSTSTSATSATSSGSLGDGDSLTELTLELATGQLTAQDLTPAQAAALQQASQQAIQGVQQHVGADLEDVLTVIAKAQAAAKKGETLSSMAATRAIADTEEEAADKMSDSASQNYASSQINDFSTMASGGVTALSGAVAGYQGMKAGDAVVDENTATQNASDAADRGDAAIKHSEKEIARLQNGPVGEGVDRQAGINVHEQRIVRIKATTKERVNEHTTSAAASKKAQEVHRAKSGLYTSIGQGMSSVIQGGGGLVSASDKHNADLDDVASKRLQALADAATAARDQSSSLAQSAQTSVETARSALHDITSDRSSAESQLIQNV